MHSPVSATRVWYYRLIALYFGVLFWIAGSLMGCSSSNTSAATKSGSARSDIPTAQPQVYETLTNSCFDCHSNRGSGSWFAKLAPSYLFGANKGRTALNFANWSTMDAGQQSAMASAIVAVVDRGSMPPGDYTFFHPSAKLSDEQKTLLTRWASEQKALPAH